MAFASVNNRVGCVTVAFQMTQHQLMLQLANLPARLWYALGARLW